MKKNLLIIAIALFSSQAEAKRHTPASLSSGGIQHSTPSNEGLCADFYDLDEYRYEIFAAGYQGADLMTVLLSLSSPTDLPQVSAFQYDQVQLPNFTALKKLGRFGIQKVDFPLEAASFNPFGISNYYQSMVGNDWYGIVMTGEIFLPSDPDVHRNYRFQTVSDDGIRVSIEGSTVVENLGILETGEYESAIATYRIPRGTGGWKKIAIEYFQGPLHNAGAILKWSDSDSGPLDVVPTTALRKNCR